jgi:hypothetical protein
LRGARVKNFGTRGGEYLHGITADSIRTYLIAARKIKSFKPGVR